MFPLNHVVLRGIILVAFSNAGLGFPLKAALEPARWCIPVSGAAGGGPGQAEESIRAQGKERPGKILSAFGSIVINIWQTGGQASGWYGLHSPLGLGLQ